MNERKPNDAGRQKSVNMAALLDVPVLGLIENMAYVKCPDCQRSTWVYRIALNVCISQSRKKDNQTHQPINEEVTGLSENTTEQEQVQQLYQLIQKLNQEEQALIYLYLDEKSHKEIADIMGVSVSNVGTKIQRIKLKLKQLSNE